MITNGLSQLLSDQTLAVVGGVGGDEGKGKIVASFAKFFGAVVRFSGGSNAGHTTYTEVGRKLVGHLIPSGLVAGVPCVIARGVFFDAARFVTERDEASGILDGKPPPILVDGGCTLWTPYHALFEMWCEDMRAGDRIGTTGRGIGPLAAIRDLRVDLKVEDLELSSVDLQTKVEQLYRTLEPVLWALRRHRAGTEHPVEVPAPVDVVSQLLSVADQVLPHKADTRVYLSSVLQQDGKILFEGAQAAMLDLMWGTYPYVSAGMCTASGVAQGTGLPFNVLKASCVVTKVMPTRVGVGGPMPSEFWDRAAAEEFPKRHPEFFDEGPARTQALERLRDLINSGQAGGETWSNYVQIINSELGATSGRGRSPGATDFPYLDYAVAINAPKFMALTRLDTLSGLKCVPVTTAYRLDGSLLPDGQMPTIREMYRVEPVLEHWPCWQDDITGIREERRLPRAAQDFLARFEERVGVPISIVGTGPGPHDLIVR